MNKSISIAEAPTSGIGKLIADNRFFVPTHQRDYSWDRDRVEKFFDDLISALENESLYFIGMMVFMRGEGGRLRVLDGQQRLATVIIVFSALRAWFGTAQSAGSDTQAQLQYDFVGRKEYGDPTATPKLSMNMNNDDLFQEFVVNGSQLHLVKDRLKKTSKHDSNYQLLDAIGYSHDRISKLAQQNGEAAADVFNKLIKFLRDSVIVVRLTVPDESNAFKVFETLNDRGMDLSAIDLVKNYLFGLAYQQSAQSLKQIEHRWSQLSDILKDSKSDDFLKTFWNSRHGLAYIDDIFDGLKKTCKTPNEAIDLSQDMLEAAEHFAALNNPDDVVWKPYSEKCQELIGELRVLGTKLVRPVVLSALKRFDARETERLIWLLQVIIVRWQIISEGRPGIIEKACARLAHSIWKNEVTTASQALTILAEPYGTDTDFQENFARYENSGNTKTVFLLRKLEVHERAVRRGQSAFEVLPAKLTLEHILPRSPSEEWRQVIEADPTVVAQCAERLGNLCLVGDSRNRELSRHGFEKKKNIFSDSDILLTKNLKEKDAWNRREIEQRQTYLASRAVLIWKFDST
jgi:hypothetical protein